jgi:DNA-binding CsgD family transcriptional regulator
VTGPRRRPEALHDLGISRREAEVLRFVVDRYRNADIADRLGVSKRTVESHVSSLLRKVGVADRRALMAAGADALGDPVPLRADGHRAAAPPRTRARPLATDTRAMRRRAAQLRAHSMQHRLTAIDHIERSRRRLESSRHLIQESRDELFGQHGR